MIHQVNFDIERMKKALAGPRHILPQGLSLEEIRDYLLAKAKEIREQQK